MRSLKERNKEMGERKRTKKDAQNTKSERFEEVVHRNKRVGT